MGYNQFVVEELSKFIHSITGGKDFFVVCFLQEQVTFKRVPHVLIFYFI